MARKKDHISLRKKLAAALRHMMIEDENGNLVPALTYEEAKELSEDQVLSLFHFDHGIHEAIGGETSHWNLTPRFIADHRRKTATIDRPQIEKTKRITAKQEAFRAKMLAKSGDDVVETVTERRKSSWKSRPFPKRPDGQKFAWGRRRVNAGKTTD